MPAQLRKDVFRRHADLYRSLPPSAHAAFDAAARAAAAERQRQAQAEREHREASLQLHVERLQAERGVRGWSTRAADVRLDTAELAALADLLREPRWSRAFPLGRFLAAGMHRRSEAS